MNSGRMVHTLVAMMMTLGLSTIMTADTGKPLPPIEVIYLGRIAPEADQPYQSFIRALEALPRSLRVRMQIKFVQAMDNTTWRFDEAAAEAVQAKPAAIVAPNTAAARAFERHRSDMPPVIFSSFLDPVRYRVVATTSPRAESITGIWVAEDLDGKRVEILKDAYPHIKKVAVLMDRYWAENSDAAINLPKAAKQLDLTITLLLAEDLKDVTAVLDSAIARHFDAWCLPPSGVAYLNSDFILDRLRQWGKPVIVASPQDVERGAPLSYTVDENFRFAAMADLLRRVLEGEPAGSIPVQRPPQPKLAVRAMPTDGFPPPGAAVVKRADVVLR